jgi:hypothetical protein
MQDVATLRRQADHARRLAGSISDTEAIDQLESFAEELDREVEKQEAASRAEDS